MLILVEIASEAEQASGRPWAFDEHTGRNYIAPPASKQRGLDCLLNSFVRRARLKKKSFSTIQWQSDSALDLRVGGPFWGVASYNSAEEEM